MDTAPVITRIRSELATAGPSEAVAYLLGALHDGCFNRLHRTIRISQADLSWLDVLRFLLEKLGKRSWLYREGTRNVWTLESTYCPTRAPLQTARERAAYARGYFDAEGGLPKHQLPRFYLQLVQKNRQDLQELHDILGALGIHCGAIHNPSKEVDPEYWRFYVRTTSHLDFIVRIGSWHPRKRFLLEARRTHLEVKSMLRPNLTNPTLSIGPVSRE